MSLQYGLLLLAAVVIIALLLVLAVLAGLKRSKSKQISFEKPAPPHELTQEEKSGNYQAKGSFNFEAGGLGPSGKQTQPIPSTPLAPSSSVLSAEVHSTLEMEPLPESEDTSGKPNEPLQSGSGDSDNAFPQASEEAQGAVSEVAEAPSSGVSEDEESTLDGDLSASSDHSTEQSPQDLDVQEMDKEKREIQHSEDVDSTDDELLEEPSADTAVDDIAPASGRLGKLRGRLAKSQNVFGKSVLGMLSAGDLDDDAWEEIEDTLISADLGSAVTMRVVDKLREIVAVRGVSSEAEARAMLREVLIEACQPQLDRSIKAMPYEGKPAVVLVAGVNGTGKTTTTGKLGRVLVSMGHSVVFGAADTFRAAAADQLEAWGRRVGAVTVRGKEGADPASVAFDAVSRGLAENADVVLIDTAGRLHTEVGLMDQLGKIKRVVEKKAVVDEVLLVLDATVGQNGLMQARTFKEVVDITGVVLTKLDGSAKGGIVFQVQEELKVPVKLVGLGEGADDLAPFEVESFIDALLG